MAVSRGGTVQPSPILAEQLVRVERVEAAVVLLHGVRLQGCKKVYQRISKNGSTYYHNTLGFLNKLILGNR